MNPSKPQFGVVGRSAVTLARMPSTHHHYVLPAVLHLRLLGNRHSVHMQSETLHKAISAGAYFIQGYHEGQVMTECASMHEPHLGCIATPVCCACR